MNFLQKLRAELSRWQREGIITQEQAQAIESLYPNEQPWYRRISVIVGAVAIVFFFLSLLLILSENWQHIPRSAKIVLVAIPLLAAHFAAWKNKDNRNKADLYQFFASLALGLNIYLQAQTFQIGEYYPDGLLLWAAGALPAALYFRPPMHMYLIAALGIAYTSAQIQYDKMNPLPLFLFGYVAWIALRESGWFRSLILLIFGHLLLYAYAPEAEDEHLFQIWGAANLAQYALFYFLKEKRDGVSDKFYRELSAFFLFLPVFILTFPDAWSDSPKGSSYSWITSALAVAAAGVLFYASAKAIGKQNPENNSLPEILLPAAPVFASGVFFLSTFAALWSKPLGTFVANVLFLGSAAFYIWYGIRFIARSRFFLGIGFLFLWAGAHFVDYFKDYILSSLFFLAIGVALIMLNKFWVINMENKHER